MTEQWKPALGWEGVYEVSDMGRVRSLDRTIDQRDGTSRFFPGQILKQTGMNGYRTVGLHFAGKERRRTVHSLVLEAFTCERPTGMQACHYDGDRANNKLSNLRWDTVEGNARDKLRHGTNVREAMTHCFKGHELDHENTYVSPNGARACKTCRLDANRASYYRNIERSREYARNYYRENYAVPEGEKKPNLSQINAAKSNCKRGHPLEMPNLMPGPWRKGHRACLACSRAHAYVNRHKSLKPELQAVSDRYYLEIRATNNGDIAA